jgi:hypothetical protein
MDSPELVFQFSSNGKASATVITAKIGDEVLACEKGDVTKSRFRGEVVDSVCKGRPGIKRVEVERILLAHAAEHAARQAKQDEKPAPPESQELLMKMPEHVRDQARSMLEDPNLLSQCCRDVWKLGVAGEAELIGVIYLVGTSRLLPRPLSAIIMSPSSTGKSFVIERVADLFPPEAIVRSTSMTAQALYYLPPGDLCHKWIVSGERSRREDDDTAEATRALREMIGSGKLTKMVPVKEDGKMVTQRIEQPGPIAFTESTTLTKVFDEDQNRCLLLSADERPEQTRAVISRLAATYGGEDALNTEAVIQRHHALQRMLQQRPIHIPFAAQIGEVFPHEQVEARRAFGHFMGTIQALALLHQHQRQIDGDGRIVATMADYRLARLLVRGPLGRLLGGSLSGATIRFHERLTGWVSGSFSTTDAKKKDRKARKTINAWLSDLVDAGAVQQVEAGKGQKPAVWRLTEMTHDELAAQGFDLPEEL